MKEFKEVIEELIAVFIELSGIANVKLSAAKNNRAATVEECLKKEQAVVMKLRGLEAKREKIQAEMGFEGLKFKEILEKLSEEEREDLLPYFDALSREIQLFDHANENVQTMLKVNLRNIDRELENRQKSSKIDANVINKGKQFTDTIV